MGKKWIEGLMILAALWAMDSEASGRVACDRDRGSQSRRGNPDLYG